jgi:hypothetical protein
MNNRTITAASILLVIIVSDCCIHRSGYSRAFASGLDYLGQAPPGTTPQLFGSGFISTEANELNCAISPHGDEIVFSVNVKGQNTLYRLRRASDGTWGSREKLWFSGNYSDVDPCYSPQGDTLFFSSKRPLEGIGPAKDSDLWCSIREHGGEWNKPVILKGINTLGKDDYYTSVTSGGDMYFSLFETRSGGDLYFAEKVADGYGEPVLLREPISTAASEHDPFIAPDGSYLFFTSDRTGGHGRGDLYITFRQVDGTWREPMNMGRSINTAAYEYCAMVSPDGKYLFFTRSVRGNGDIYWVDTSIIEDIRNRK